MRWPIREERRKDVELGNATFREMRDAYRQQAIDAKEPELTGAQLLSHWKSLRPCEDEEGAVSEESQSLPVKAMPPRAPYETTTRASAASSSRATSDADPLVSQPDGRCRVRRRAMVGADRTMKMKSGCKQRSRSLLVKWSISSGSKK